jgi:hypothetical protein
MRKKTFQFLCLHITGWLSAAKVALQSSDSKLPAIFRPTTWGTLPHRLGNSRITLMVISGCGCGVHEWNKLCYLLLYLT